MKEHLHPPIAVALYARVSSERQDVDISVSAQLRALRDYANRNGYVLAREYVDEAESGRVATRPQFRRMLNEASKPHAPFEEILVWKFSRFTRKREHAVAFKAMLRRRGIRVTSITEHDDDSPTGKLMEAIIESVDEFYSENLAQEVVRGMRESASRGFWVTTGVPFGYEKVYVQDGPKKRPKLELDPPVHALLRRILRMALNGRTTLEITKTFNAEGIATPEGKRWLKTTVYRILSNETYTGALVWGVTAKDGAPLVRVDNAFPAIVTPQEFRRVNRQLRARSPKHSHPRLAASPYLLSGTAVCETCGKAMSASEAKSGRYSYYVCHSLLKQGRGTCATPRLNAKRFEKLIIEQIRDHILAESNLRDLVKMVDEELDDIAVEERVKLETIEAELLEVRQRMDRLWRLVETTDLQTEEILPRLRHHQERQEQLERTADDARVTVTEHRQMLDKLETVTAYVRDMAQFLQESDLTETKAFIRSFVKQAAVSPNRAVIHYNPDSVGQPHSWRGCG